ncbi:MAG: cell division protein FtsL [Treponema sp.]|nr:cell division protein FtsL [Treponema sp.]
MNLPKKYSEKKPSLKIHLLVYLFAILVPVLLILNAVHANRYTELKRELSRLEKSQVQLVEKNRELISEISVLSSSDRIERIAERDLGMHKAKKEEIVRVEIKTNKN